MAALTSTLQLLFLGALISPVYLEQNACDLIKNTTAIGNYSLSVNPTIYKANTTYNVTVSGATNSTSLVLQAINAQNVSVGQWNQGTPVNCSNGAAGTQNNFSSSIAVQWTSPGNETAPVEIRAFVTFSDNSTKLQKTTLNTESTTASPGTTTRNSVSTAKANSFLVTAIQLLSVFVTSKLFSC